GAALRVASATARRLLLRAAAERLGCQAETLSLADGLVCRDGAPTGLDLWQLAPAVDWSAPFDMSAVRNPAAERDGDSTGRIDLAGKRTGGGFIHDMALPDMLHARVLRQPVRLARLLSVDEDWLARRHPTVRVWRKADFLALLSADEHAVHAAHAEADRFVAWGDGDGRWRPAEAGGRREWRVGGDAAQVPGTPAIRSRYSRPSILHASIGPSCALARFVGGRLTVWSHSQGIFALRDVIASVLGLERAAVRLIHAHGAGCYGHNGADDAALDAAILAEAFPGRVVRVQWSRQDELSRAPVGAAMATEIAAALDGEGRVSRWTAEIVSQPHAQRPGFGGHANLTSAEALDPARCPTAVADLPDMAGGGASRNAAAIYDFPDQAIAVTLDASSPVRT
ncbi:molybdopterin-dependent oxidoreductase, partial [Rhizobium sp. TRM95111]|uniref:molybdopterin cofactor-binding domain-containing protein n=1 Tax=Rhizobium alarense TaxID=2846851 RepID=UPI001F414485